jgi:hypothetical protein
LRDGRSRRSRKLGSDGYRRFECTGIRRCFGIRCWRGGIGREDRFVCIPALRGDGFTVVLGNGLPVVLEGLRVVADGLTVLGFGAVFVFGGVGVVVFDAAPATPTEATSMLAAMAIPATSITTVFRGFMTFSGFGRATGASRTRRLLRTRCSAYRGSTVCVTRIREISRFRSSVSSRRHVASENPSMSRDRVTVPRHRRYL